MGGLAGLLGQLFGYGSQGQSAASQLSAQGVTGPATPNLTGFNAAQGNEGQLFGTLQGEAAGTGPSSSQAMLSQAIQQALGAQSAAAAGGRYGQNAATRQQGVATQAAGLEGGAANQAAGLRAQERQAGAQGAAALSGQMGQQQLGAASLDEQGKLAYNQQLGNLYGAEQGQTAAAGQALQSSLMNAAGGAMSMGSGMGGGGGGGGSGPYAGGSSTPYGGYGQVGGMGGSSINGMAKGGVVDHHTEGMKHLTMALAHMHEASGGDKMAGGGISALLTQLAPMLMAHGGMGAGKTEVGERGPELLTSPDKSKKPALIDHPMMLNLGQRSRDVVLPLEKGSAPYHGGEMREEGRPTTPAPKHPQIKHEAKEALAGRAPIHEPGPGADALSPRTRPIVEKAMAAHGMASALRGPLHPAVLAMMHPRRA